MVAIDIIAGLTVAAMIVPEGIAYAGIAGMPPETALYAAWIALLAFAVFGSSKQLIIGVSAAVATISFGTVSSLADPGTPEFIQMTTALAILAGLFSILFGLFKLGVVAQFFSESVMAGFVTGIALVTAIKQVPKVLGIPSGDGNFWQRSLDIARNIGETHWQTVVIGVLCIGIMVGVERYVERIPAALVTLIAGIAISGVAEHGIAGRRCGRRHPLRSRRTDDPGYLAE